jgi:hypothetical protein
MRNKLLLFSTFALTIFIISCQKTDDILAMLKEIKQQNTDLKAQVSSLQKTTDSLSAALKLTNQNISGMDKKIDSIRNQLSILVTQINGLNTQLSQANVNIADLQKRIAELQAKCQELVDLLRVLTGTMNLSEGLVAFYPFTGNAGDSSGNGNHGTVNGSQLSNDRFGNVRSSYFFNGQTNWISVAATNSLLPSKISISFWTKIPSNYTGNNAIGRMVRSRFYGYMFDYDSSSNNIVLRIHTDTSQPTTCSTSGYKYNDNKWHSVIGTFDGTNVKLYVDGQLSSSAQSRSQNIYYQSDGLIQFGKDGNNSSPLTALFQGWLDDIRVYNRPLTQQEIAYLATR